MRNNGKVNVMIHTLSGVLLLFFVYCFIGWLWESCYVSVKKHRWVNRGFLRGPWLPIYGAGAGVILLSTLWVREYWPLVFLLGMASATVLEYATGAVMERLFQTRYWDYSDVPCNLNGYICLWASLGWGLFSVLLVRVVHPVIRRLVLAIPTAVSGVAGWVLTVLFVMDVSDSARAALDLKELMNSLTASNRLVESVTEKLEELSERLNRDGEPLRQRLRQLETELTEEREQRRQKRLSRNERLLQRLEERRDWKAGLLSALTERCDAVTAELAERLAQPLPEEERDRLLEARSAAVSVQASLHKAEVELAARRQRDFRRIAALLERNPSARSRQHGAAVEELLEVLRRSRK